MPPAPDGKIYSATYSNVPVYEFNVAGNHVMRRRADDWINATHILKVADFDKPARTRILEREVQKGVHEKVQGGYGKYQGTWVPLHDGRLLAERNQVLHKLLPIFDFVPGDRSPPPAPKHATAASNRPKAPRQSAAAARRNGNNIYSLESLQSFVTANSQSQVSEEQYEDSQIQSQPHPYREETPDNDTVVSESMLGDQDMLHASQYSTGSRKRKRGADQMSVQDQQHQIWADALLDYFMLLDSDDQFVNPPEPPTNVNLDRPIDEKGHSAMHWAAAMGDVAVVKELLRRGARIDCLSNNLETPLMRAVMFTNNHDKKTMPQMVKILAQTVVRTDWFGSTVFHHIAATTSSTNKFVCARYYMDEIMNKLLETWIPDEVSRVLNMQDQNGDTAIMIAARNGARKCVRSLLGRNVAVDIPNKRGETADDLIRELNQRRRLHGRPRQASSSPFAPPPEQRINGHGSQIDGPVPLIPLPFPSLAVREPAQYRSQTASHLMTKVAPTLLEKCEELAAAYESELQEKEAESLDAERVVKKRQAEIEAIRKQVAELVSMNHSLQDNSGLGDEEADRAQEEELRLLVEEAESLLEVEQKNMLRHLCAEVPQHDHSGSGVSPPGSTVDLNERMRLSLLLHRAQLERRELVKEVVSNMSVAGIGEKQAVYKSLIAKALGEREEDVEAMLPEILNELQEGAMAEMAEGLEASPL
ncbi:apses-domain-containing protein [Lindgomyces ingoldianus]|uniref:Apses-domain-containing protein n=1 Tax=Lindgomyces ingoldianus TaxID=673940 RepID=A0ACB6QT71_9PLEO|nr:apses-domain-containing protein [Lindgomyces ingoldianus]KAF2470224.1 apses-domain-containing protein [Lindgomyces ingoldianus]